MYVCIGHCQHLHLAHRHPSSLRVWVRWILGQVRGDVLGGLDLEVGDLVTFRGLQSSCPLLNEMHASSNGCVTVARPTLQLGSPADLCRLSRGNSFPNLCIRWTIWKMQSKKAHHLVHSLVTQHLDLVGTGIYTYTPKLSIIVGIWGKVTKKNGM
jgi:hypothetical protein